MEFGHHNIIIYSMKIYIHLEYLLNITFNNVIKWLVFLKIYFNVLQGDNVNVNIKKMSVYN